MGFFNWFRKGGIPETVYSVMNDDHVELYRIVGDLQSTITASCKGETEHGFRKSKIMSIIDQLIDKSQAHFEREEALMAQYRYPEAREHKSEHLMLLRSIETYRANLKASGTPITKEVVQYLKDWLTNHIRSTDRRLDRFLITATRNAAAPAHATVAQAEEGWTAGNTLLWASFNDSVARETVSGNRQQVQNSVQAMNERHRLEQSRRRHDTVREKLASDQRKMHAVYYE